ncbi:MAG: Ig domain-containing protein [Lachnospiraceae bacterium]|nr:Ig domain-containing protein [Lachnospiraceae bacterium]
MRNCAKKIRRHISNKAAFLFIMCAVAVILVGSVLFGRDNSHAADNITIERDGVAVDPGEHIQMTTSNMTLILKSEGNIYNDPEQYAINWTIESPEHQKRAKIENGTSSIYGLVTALEPGEVQIMVNVVDKLSPEGGGIVASASCWVDIIFSIDTLHDDNSFKFLYEGDTSRSLIKYSDDPSYKLDLAFGNPENCQWTSENEEIVTVDQNGVVTPVGAGHTNVVATYTPSGDTQTYTAYLPVYIFPKISVDGENFFTGGTKGLASGDTIYTDAFFSEINTESIQEKIVWVIKKDINGVRTVIEDSLGNKKSDLIEINTVGNVSNTPNLELTAKAGNYYIEFYPAGAYKSEDEKTTFTPTVLNLTVYAEFDNYDKTILVNDAYNLAEAFNLTVEDFLNFFSTPVIVLSSGGDASNYVKYSADTTIISALQKGTVSVTVNARSGREGNVLALCNPNKIKPDTTFNLTLRIIDSFTLDRTSVVMYKGQNLQLTPTFTSYSGVVTWETSDSKFVTVTDGGLIHAVKETAVGGDVTITATLELDDGTIKKATCIVKVEASIDKITINPASLKMQKGETQTLIANFSGNVTIAPFTWRSTDTKVCTVSAANDGKSCLVTAVNGGTATIVLTNNDNMVQVFCSVTVTVPIEKITLNQSTIDAKFYTEGTKIGYTVMPANATDLELVWSSSDENVATIDSNGLATFKGPGTTLINVFPKNNPNNTFAQCILNVIKTADSMSLKVSDVTLNVGDTHIIEYTVTPPDSLLEVSFNSSDANIAAVDPVTGIISAKKAGRTQIFAKGEGLDAPVICNVNVLQAASGISFTDKEIILQTGGKAHPNVALVPADSTDAVSWTSLDTSIASVVDGEVTGVSAGTTYIQAKAASGVDAIIPVHVRDSVTGLALDVTDKQMTVGESLKLNPVFTPANPYNQNVKWSTTNGGVVIVSNTGVVNAVGGGVAAIKCTSDDGGFQATCIITVKEPAASITLNHTSYKLGLGKKVQLTATVNSPNATDKSVKWSTSNKKIATVTKNGKVTGKKLGKCTITVRANDGSGLSATCSIRVVRRVTSVRLNRKTASVLVGNTFRLKKKIKPSNATIKSVTWSSANEEIATVDSKGNVVGVSPGVVKIIATAKDGSNKAAACLVTVKEKVSATGVSAVNSEMTMVVGTSKNVEFTTQPNNSTDNLFYTSDNSSVVTVNSRGKVYAKALGSATVYATTTSGSTAAVEIRVVSLNRSSVNMRQYDTETIWVNGVDESVKWFSQNPQIATIAGGKIVGRKPGKTTVYAVVDGTRVRCSVNIRKIK